MSRLDYCQYSLLNRDCYDWKNDNCDECNIFKAYCEGARMAKASIVRYISIILVDSALRKERQMTYETYREKANDMALEIEELRVKVKALEEEKKPTMGEWKKPWVYNPREAEERILKLEERNRQLVEENTDLKILLNQQRIKLRILEADNEVQSENKI